MGITKVPERVIITCDFCSREKQKGKDPAWLLGGRLTYCCDGLDYQGNAVGPGDQVTRDLCDRCYDAALKALSEAYYKIKRINNEQV